MRECEEKKDGSLKIDRSVYSESDLRNEMWSVLKDFINDDQTLFIISHYDLDDRYFDGTIKMRLERHNQYEQHSIINISNN